MSLIESIVRHPKVTAGVFSLLTFGSSGCTAESTKTQSPQPIVAAAVGTPTPDTRPSATATKTPAAVVENCKIRLVIAGFNYVRNPNATLTNGVINSSALAFNEVSSMGPIRITYQEDLNDPNSPKTIIANPSFDQIGNHREVLITLSQKSNTLGKDQSPALKIGISADDDLAVDLKTSLPPENPLVVRCGQDGWFYFGRLAPSSAIDQIATLNQYPMYQVGTLVDQIVKRVFGRAPGIGPKNDDPVQNFKDFKASVVTLKRESDDLKKREKDIIDSGKKTK